VFQTPLNDGLRSIPTENCMPPQMAVLLSTPCFTRTPGHLSLFSSQVSWALGALSAGKAKTQLSEGNQAPPTGCSGRLLELKGEIGFRSGAPVTTV
jgi:hypothetical protein